MYVHNVRWGPEDARIRVTKCKLSYLTPQQHGAVIPGTPGLPWGRRMLRTAGNFSLSHVLVGATSFDESVHSLGP